MGICRSTADCSAGDEIGRMTIEQCCLGTTNGLAFTEVETASCSTCIGMRHCYIQDHNCIVLCRLI